MLPHRARERQYYPDGTEEAPASVAFDTSQQRTFMKIRNGLASLLRPEDSVLVLIDHQPYQLANVNSH